MTRRRLLCALWLAPLGTLLCHALAESPVRGVYTVDWDDSDPGILHAPLSEDDAFEVRWFLDPRDRIERQP